MMKPEGTIAIYLLSVRDPDSLHPKKCSKVHFIFRSLKAQIT